MIDIKLLEKKAEAGPSYYDEYKECLLARGSNVAVLDQAMELNRKRKEAITSAESLKAHQNKVSGQIPKMKKEGADTTALLAELAQLSENVKNEEAKAAALDKQVYDLMLTLPNKFSKDVPKGSSAEENKILKTVGQPTQFSFKPKEHWELGEKLGLIDFERAGKVTGSRFSFLLGKVALMERAVTQFFLDLHTTQHGYIEVVPPYMANTASFVGVGQFPKFIEDVFHLKGTDYYLIPTAEVPLTNYFRDEILKEEQLPMNFCAFSPCFRSEAGSAGRDTTGLIRQHQFHKVELMSYAHPSKSYEIHEALTTHAERCLEELELPFRRMLLCSGDMGFGSAKTHDLEVWLPGQQAYREISSCSNFEDYQARRANIRFKSTGGKPQFVHTLNGSGLAVGRTVVAILENYQQEDGSIRIPKALQKYMGGATKI